MHTSTDGKVRAADIEYKLPGESVFRITTRPIHKLVLIIPIEEQASAVDEAEGIKAVPLTGKAPECVEVEPETATQEESEAKDEGSPALAALHPPQGKGATKPVIKIKKVVSRKKAGKQARTIVVTSPKEEAEMVDIGARPKKRGRPRKSPNVDPPDPHKGSVSYPKKGECADPVNEDAILEKEGGGEPQDRDRESQLAPDTGGDKT